MNSEVWKDIEGYNSLYQISNLGRLKSLRKNIVLKQNIVCNYNYVSLCKNGKVKNFRVHKLVANAFLKKEKYKSMPDENIKTLDLNNLEINHIDGNKQNNCVNNLEYCTKKYNMAEAYKLGLLKNNLKPKFGSDNGMAKPIQQYNLNGMLLKKYDYMSKASKELNICVSAISLCCNGKRKTAGGYIWRYANNRD